MKVITLCGSTKFKTEFEEANKRLTLEGNIVISVGLFGHADSIPLDEKTKELLDEMHKRKIDLSNEIFVVNVGGYIGYSTRSEIEYAEKLCKTIKYLDYYDMIKDAIDLAQKNALDIVIHERTSNELFKMHHGSYEMRFCDNMRKAVIFGHGREYSKLSIDTSIKNPTNGSIVIEGTLYAD